VRHREIEAERDQAPERGSAFRGHPPIHLLADDFLETGVLEHAAIEEERRRMEEARALLLLRAARPAEKGGEVPGHRRILRVGQAEGGEAETSLLRRRRIDRHVGKEPFDH